MDLKTEGECGISKEDKTQENIPNLLTDEDDGTIDDINMLSQEKILSYFNIYYARLSIKLLPTTISPTLKCLKTISLQGLSRDFMVN